MIYHEITSAENRDVVKAVGVFGVSLLPFSRSVSREGSVLVWLGGLRERDR